tara:strand:- start:596 stop:1198 length:603 start_codon:yes stop_codon:yes gene_type:complete
MKFEKYKFEIVKKAIDKNLANFLFNYLKLRKQVLDHLQETRFLSPYDRSMGSYLDTQIPNTYSIYSDHAMETLLMFLKDTIEKKTKTKLIETYSYARLYKQGDILSRHKDRSSCAISATVNLGGDPWPIYLNTTNNLAQDGFKVDLTPGDLLIYSGDKMEHWREEFQGDISGQVFLHYNTFGSKNKYDGRPMLGLSEEFK